MRLNRSQNRCGVALIYMSVMLVVLMMFASLAVDYGRAQVLKEELMRASDAGARFAAAQLAAGATIAGTQSAALEAARDNTADGSPVMITTNDVEFGTWNSTNRTFAVLSGINRTAANAIRVNCNRTTSGGNPMVTFFASAMGRRSVDVHSSAIATFVAPVTSVIGVEATSNPWLAGEGKNTYANVGNPANNPDRADSNNTRRQSPDLVTGIALTRGATLTFDSINGGANNFATDQVFTPDGNFDWIVSNFGGNELGKSNLTAPINSVIGIFIDDTVPSSQSGYPPALDFSSAQARDFDTLTPQLRQPFFVGDGMNSKGQRQQFVIPQGATRLFMGNMDGYEWNNNIGGFTTTIRQPAKVIVVQ